MPTEHSVSGIPVRQASSFSWLTERRLRLFFFLLLAVSAAARVLLSVFPKTAVTYNDELFYLEIAQNIWNKGSVSVYGVSVGFSKVLYPLLISPFFAVQNGLLRTQLISGFNAILISSALIPGWLLARRILKKPEHIAFSVLILALSPNLLLSLTFMAENLYYPLLLWSLYAVWRYLSADHPGVPFALLLGFLAFLLYITREAGAACLAGIIILLLCSRRYVLLGWTTAAFLIPCILLKLIVLPNSGFFPADAFLRFSTASDLSYLLYCVLLTALFFLISSLFFPVVIPVIQRKEFTKANQLFLVFSVSFTLALCFETGRLLMIQGDTPDIHPGILLRPLTGALYPFLLLFLQAADSEKTTGYRKKLLLCSVMMAVFTLLFFYLPADNRFTNAPVIMCLDILRNPSSAMLWITKAVILLFFSLLLFLFFYQKQRAGSFILLLSLCVTGLLGGYTFFRIAKARESISDPALIDRIQALDTALRKLGGNTLVVVPDSETDTLKTLNTLSGSDYAVVNSDDIALCYPQDAEPVATWSLDPLALPEPSGFPGIWGNYKLSSVENVITLGSWLMIDPKMNEELASDDFSPFRLYRSEEPARVNLSAPFSYLPGEPICFQMDNPSFLRYLPEGFSDPETAFTWTSGNEVSLTLHPVVAEPRELIVTWTWEGVIGEQPCDIYANDTHVRSETITSSEKDIFFYIPAECYADSGIIVLRFVFPEAKEPGNGDARILAVAFHSLLLE